jgi:GT2 family glycosyltransferase
MKVRPPALDSPPRRAELERGEPASAPSSSADAPPLVTVIIPNFNGRHHLEACLPALLASRGARLEVIVVDNGSSDDSLAWLERSFPGVVALPLGHNAGFGEANRRAVARARGELIAFLNNDTVVDPGWLVEPLRLLHAQPDIGAVCSTLRLIQHPDVLNARGGGMTWLGYGYDRDFLFPAGGRGLEAEPETEEVLFPTAAAMVMRKSDFLDVGGFDPAFFMYHEDVDLGWRLWIIGLRVVVCRDSIVQHRWGGTSHSTHGLGWRERLGIRHAVRSTLKYHHPRQVLRVLVALVRIHRQRGHLGLILHALAWNLLHLPGTLRHRLWIRRRRGTRGPGLATRELIERAAYPSAPPEEPRARPEADREGWIVTGTLLPGMHSALGRLGAGWYARERVDGRWMRWTCGRARCFLRVAPGLAGRLSVRLRLPDDAGPSRQVILACNGAETRQAIGESGWTGLSIAARADSDGILDIQLRSSLRVPHAKRADGDRRTLGCGVERIAFAPADPVQAPAYSSVSVIIPTHNRRSILEMTLAALARQTVRELEVIVVDDGSTDGTWDALAAWRGAHPELRLTPVRQPNLKQGHARNNGLRHASGDLVVFLGDDIIPRPDFLAEHLAAHRRAGETVAVLGFTDWDASRMAVTPFLEFVNTAGPQFAYGHIEDGDDTFFTAFYTSNISLPRWVLGAEPFHPAFTSFGWEDTELGYRLSLRGLRIIYHAAARADHLHPMTLSAFVRRQEQVGRAASVLLELHPELAGSAAMPPLRPLPWYRWARLLMPVAVPVLDRLDRRGVRLPGWVYYNTLLAAFWTGRRRTPRA